MRCFIKILTLFTIFHFCISFDGKDKQVICATKENEFTAGDNIILSFHSELNQLAKLVLKSSYGTTVIEGDFNNHLLEFRIPSIYSRKAGIIKWELLINRKSSQTGYINVLPCLNSKAKIETYLGPRQLFAGKKDYSMLVILPSDQFDNLLPDSTDVFVRTQFDEGISETNIKIKNLFAWQNIYSKLKVGTITVMASCNSSSSKELKSVIHSSNPSDFKISYRRNHDYADGHEITTFYTSRIEDQYGNIVSDGTCVEFNINSSEGTTTKTFGSTVNGIASSSIIQPVKAEQWTVNALIYGLAESNQLELVYQSSLSDLRVEFSENNRKLVVGPLKSFMDQMIPDGSKVFLQLINLEDEMYTIKRYAKDGFADFELSEEYFIKGKYHFTIQTMGVTKELKNVDIK